MSAHEDLIRILPKLGKKEQAVVAAAIAEIKEADEQVAIILDGALRASERFRLIHVALNKILLPTNLEKRVVDVLTGGDLETLGIVKRGLDEYAKDQH